MRSAAVALLLLLAGCGSGSEEQAPAPTPSASGPASAGATDVPSAAPTSGTPAPEALSGFRCESDDDGDWAAKGVVANSGKAATTFQVTVHVGSATGGEERAKTTRVASVAPGGSAPFTIRKIPAPEDGGTCHVQVLASR